MRCVADAVIGFFLIEYPLFEELSRFLLDSFGLSNCFTDYII
jgi:hypothetical protein